MKRMKWVFLTLLILVVATVGIILIRREMNTDVIDKSDAVVMTVALEQDETIQLSAPAESEEEAKKIAELYGIDYIGYYRGYGQYETTQDVNSLKELGLENNYPDLEIIYKSLTK